MSPLQQPIQPIGLYKKLTTLIRMDPIQDDTIVATVAIITTIADIFAVPAGLQRVTTVNLSPTLRHTPFIRRDVT